MIAYQKTLDYKYILYAVFTSVTLVLQFVPILNLIYTIFVFAFVILSFYKRWISGFIPILALSFIHGEDSVSIYTLKIGGVSLFYVLIIMLFAIKIVSRRRVSRVELFVTLYFFFYVMFSIVMGNFYELKYFVNDTLFLLVGLLFLYIIYDNKNIPVDKLLLSLSMGYFFTKVFVFHSGIGLQVIPYSETVDQYNAIFDPVENFLIIYNLQVIFMPKIKAHRILATLNVIFFSYASYLVGYVHGATIMLLLFVTLYNLFRGGRFFLYFTMMIVFSLAVFLTVGVTISYGEESVFLYKIEKILGLFQFFYDSNITIYDLPRSTQVRLIETANLLNQNWALLFLGNGFGGYITETAYTYGAYLNQDDYSVDQIIAGKYQVLHAYNQIVLKHGLLSLIIATVFFYVLRERSYRNFRDTATIFIVFSYSFTIKPYLILALLVVVMLNKNGCELEK